MWYDIRKRCSSSLSTHVCSRDFFCPLPCTVSSHHTKMWSRCVQIHRLLSGIPVFYRRPGPPAAGWRQNTWGTWPHLIVLQTGMDWRPWWHPDREMISALLALCVGNPLVTSGFPSQRASNAELSLFLCWYPGQAVEQTVELQVIWGVTMLMLCHHNAQQYLLNLTDSLNCFNTCMA